MEPSDNTNFRRQIDALLPTDADLDAFCLDCFPEVFQRFTNGMERTQKLNLLFMLQPDRAEMVARLRERHSGYPGRLSGQLQSRRTWRPLVLGLAGLLVVLVPGYALLRPRHSPPTTAPVGQGAVPAAIPLAPVIPPAAKLDIGSDNVVEAEPGSSVRAGAAAIPSLKADASPVNIRIGSGNHIVAKARSHVELGIQAGAKPRRSQKPVQEE